MPFSYSMSRYTREAVSSLNPGQAGVYGIFRGSQCVYVGSSDDLRRRMLEHLNGDNPCINGNRPDRWTAIVTPYYEIREEQLTLEYGPICNKRVG